MYRLRIEDKAQAENASAKLNEAKGLSKEDRRRVIEKAYAVLGWPNKENPDTP